jgi:hypothetical protein
MPKEHQHPARTSNLIKHGMAQGWLFVEQLGRGKIALSNQAEASDGNPTEKRPLFWLSHPRYYTGRSRDARLRTNTFSTMKALSNNLLSDYTSIMEASLVMTAYLKIVRPMMTLLVDSVVRKTGIEFSANK